MVPFLVLVQALVQAGAAVDAVNQDKRTPLHFAANAGHTNGLARLVANHPSC